jgi:D-alanyl-D-alanine carboxypeptidase
MILRSDDVKQIDFNQLTNDMLKNKSVFGSVLHVYRGDEALFMGSSGFMKKDDTYFIASVTKLYVTALMLILRNQAKIKFSDKLISYYPEDQLKGLHVFKGVDYTHQITICHLLSNQTGLPDYYYYNKQSADATKDLSRGSDEAWPLDKVIERVKRLKPKYPPGQKGKVNYSDTNYQLLGGIIEYVTKMTLADAFRHYLFEPLKLKKTYAYTDPKDQSPSKFYLKKEILFPSNYLASVTAEGGIVSNAEEVMIFLRAFMNGFFFPKETLQTLTTNWRMILFPGQFYFGLGIEKLWTPWFLSPGRPIKNILGFWGQTGSFAFYHPESMLYFTGTVNQASGFGHSAAFSAMIKIIQFYMKEKI